MKHSFAKMIVLSLTALILVSACNEEGKHGPEGSPSTVKFVMGGNSYQTKSSDAEQQLSACEPIDISEETGIKGLVLAEEVSSLDDLYFNDADTKGTPVFTENIEDIYSTIAVTAYNGGSEYGAAKADYDYTGKYQGGKVYSHDYGVGTLEWPDDGLLFFFKAPAGTVKGLGTVTYDSANNKITFPYESPASAVDQKDILFSSKHMTRNTSYEQNRVLLYHALTGVKFKLKNADGKDVTIQSITKVTLTNIISKGTCTIAPSYEGGSFNTSNEDGGVAKSATVSTWKFDATPVKSSFSQSFASTEQGVDLTDGDYDYPTSFSGNKANTEGNLNDTNASKTFLFIPQTLGTDVALTIEYTYKVGGSTRTATTTIDFGKKVSQNVWKAGELHTYTLQLGDKVDVVIDDTVNTASQKKTDLTITNTGTATSYIRVAAIGNWFSDLSDDEITAGYPVAITACPELKALVGEKYNTTDWIKGDDGYFYYRYPVAGGRTITNAHTLFQTLDLSSLEKPYTNCHLEVVFPVQAVRAADLRTWTSSTSYWDWKVVSAIKDNTTTQD